MQDYDDLRSIKALIDSSAVSLLKLRGLKSGLVTKNLPACEVAWIHPIENYPVTDI